MHDIAFELIFIFKAQCNWVEKCAKKHWPLKHLKLYEQVSLPKLFFFT